MRTLEYAQPTEQMKLTDVMDLDTAAPVEIHSFLTIRHSSRRAQ